MTEPIRRIVVSPDPHDPSRVVVRDAPATAVTELPAVPGTSLVDIWRSDRVPLPLPTEQDPTDAPFELMPTGSLFRIIDLAPTGDSEPMWHRTDSVDFIYIAEGEVALLHRQGEIDLKAGDTIVVGAVEHAWVNRSDSSCRIVDVSVATSSP
jgi:mannose-6-phosphate isomerase-like protein (cupin superfamily)